MYQLTAATVADRDWLERLRREVYRELFQATFGEWDEARHARHCAECWRGGRIWIIEVDATRVGMIQLFETPGALEVAEIQILLAHQNRGIGGAVLQDTISRAHRQGRKVNLGVALKNEGAYRFYKRLGFRQIRQSDTHHHLSCDAP